MMRFLLSVLCAILAFACACPVDAAVSVSRHRSRSRFQVVPRRVVTVELGKSVSRCGPLGCPVK